MQRASRRSRHVLDSAGTPIQWMPRFVNHVRLGDVVVSDRRGVIQHDLVNRTPRATEVRASSRPPHARLLEAMRLLGSDAMAGDRPWERHVERATERLPGAARPEAWRDVLHASHEPKKQVEHPVDGKRIDGQPRIFEGRIASGNMLLSDPVLRDHRVELHPEAQAELRAAPSGPPAGVEHQGASTSRQISVGMQGPSPQFVPALVTGVHTRPAGQGTNPHGSPIEHATGSGAGWVEPQNIPTHPKYASLAGWHWVESEQEGSVARQSLSAVTASVQRVPRASSSPAVQLTSQGSRVRPQLTLASHWATHAACSAS